MLYKVVSVLNY